MGVGAFAVALGLLLRLYVYPSVAKLPLDVNSVSVTQGHNVTSIVIDTVNGVPSPEIRHGLNVTSTTHVTGDPSRPEAATDGDVAVWTQATRTVDDASGTLINASVRALCVDRHTGEAVAPCASQYVEAEQGKRVGAPKDVVQQPGLSFSFPFGTRKQSYQLYDETLKRAVEARYEGEDTVHGVAAYKFVARTDPTDIGEQDVPGSLLGRDEDSVRVGQYYSDERTMWVEPHTGVLLDVVDVSRTEMLAPGQLPGQGVAFYDGTMRLSDKTVEDNVNQARTGASEIQLLTFWPIVGWIGGVVLIVAGMAVLAVRRKAKHRAT